MKATAKRTISNKTTRREENKRRGKSKRRINTAEIFAAITGISIIIVSGVLPN